MLANELSSNRSSSLMCTLNACPCVDDITGEFKETYGERASWHRAHMPQQMLTYLQDENYIHKLNLNHTCGNTFKRAKLNS